MTGRSLASIGVALSVAVALSVTLAGQAGTPAQKAAKPAAPGKAYTPPRTPDGQPDLQGFWTNSTYVPLERPKDVTKDYYTPAEAEEAMKKAAEREAEQTEPGTTADVHYDFSQFGLDRSQSTFARSLRTSLVFDPPDGRMPPVNAAGQKRAAERAAARKAMGGQYDSVQNMPIGSRCIIMGGAGPPLMNAGYNANYQIVQAPGHVMILTEMIHDVRVIPLDSRPQAPGAVRQWTGLSRGRWEGNTLVVETTNINPDHAFRGVPYSDEARVSERFTRVDDDTILYEFTVDDPRTYTAPWGGEIPFERFDDQLYEYACHEGNYALGAVLSGARYEESLDRR